MKGWNQRMFATIGAACGAGNILGLDRAAMGNAISIAITTGVPSRSVRPRTTASRTWWQPRFHDGGVTPTTFTHRLESSSSC